MKDIYLQKGHTLIINGVNISGFAEGDCIRVQPEGNAAIKTKGADGPSLSISTYQGGKLEFDLKPTSPARSIVWGLWRAQSSASGLTGPYTVVLLTGVDEIITVAGLFGEIPQFSMGGPQMQPRKFPMECTVLEIAG